MSLLAELLTIARGIAIGLALIASSADALEMGKGENGPRLEVQRNEVFLTFIDTESSVPAFRQKLDKAGQRVGKRESLKKSPTPPVQWIYSPEAQAIREATPRFDALRFYKVDAPLRQLEQIVQLQDMLIGVTADHENEDIVDLSLVAVSMRAGEVKRMTMGRAVKWEPPSTSEILLVDGTTYVAWMRAIPVSSDAALVRSHGASSLIADLVVTRWVPGSTTIEDAVIKKDAAGLSHISIAIQGKRLFVAADGQSSRILTQAMDLSALKFSNFPAQ